jgi:hypothetical protein
METRVTTLMVETIGLIPLLRQTRSTPILQVMIKCMTMEMIIQETMPLAFLVKC